MGRLTKRKGTVGFPRVLKARRCSWIGLEREEIEGYVWSEIGDYTHQAPRGRSAKTKNDTKRRYPVKLSDNLIIVYRDQPPGWDDLSSLV
ncbi:MAG: hypothetical protein OXI56_07855 [bacterium]|nr:hypothetical protein [bacterium]MDE0601691.1 hypothetical protein [bacterium]